jgi:hypothetical protein
LVDREMKMKNKPTHPKSDWQRGVEMTLLIRRAQERAQKYVRPNESLADELLAERRRQAAEE